MEAKSLPAAAPKVSVVLCGYNQSQFLRQAVDSVLAQTYPGIELVAVDNGSTDGSKELLSALRGDPRVKLLLHDTNGPVTKRLNEGIRASSGDLVSFLYADDYYLPHKTQVQVDAFHGLPPEYGVVYSPGFILDETTGERRRDSSITASGNVLDALLDAYPVFLSTLSPLVRRECLLRYPFDERVFIQGENIYLWIAMRYKFLHAGEPCVVLRDRPTGAAKAIKKTSAIVKELLARLEAHPDFPAGSRPRLARYRARLFRNYAWQGLRLADDAVWAQECLRLALGYDLHVALEAKTLAALAVSRLPKPLLRAANAAANHLRAVKAGAAIREDYS